MPQKKGPQVQARPQAPLPQAPLPQAPAASSPAATAAYPRMLRRCPLHRPEEFAGMKGGHLAGMKGGHLAGEDGQDTITVAAGQAA